jgi:uncharacterized protein (TIGR02147 family)
MNLYEYFSYKTYLIDLVSQTNIKVSALSEMAGCNRSYFSQMINGKVQLTSDHIINLAEGLDFSELEKEYFITLCLLERSSLINTKDVLEKKLNRLRQKNLVLSKKIKDEGKSFELTDEMKGEYYSSWVYGQIHILTSIEEFQTPESIALKLNISLNSVKKILNRLRDMQLVLKKENNYIHQARNLHIPHISPHNVVNHMNWRMRAIQKVQEDNGIHYTAAFSLSKKDIPVLKAQLLDFIKKQREVIGASGTEEVYCFNCDLFDPS